jgi:hypothetical protein
MDGACSYVETMEISAVDGGDNGAEGSPPHLFQSKALRMIMDAPWYVSNTVIQKDLQIPTVKHEISRYSYHYSKRLSVHPNELILNLQEPPETC